MRNVCGHSCSMSRSCDARGPSGAFWPVLVLPHRVRLKNMRMMRSTALAVSATAFLAACSDSPTAPPAPIRNLGTPSFALGDVSDGLVDNVPAVGRFTICKTEDSNVSGVFTIATQSINGGTGDVAGGTVATGGSIT